MGTELVMPCFSKKREKERRKIASQLVGMEEM